MVKIGITERGDPGIDLSWVPKLDTVDGAVLVTKCISSDLFDEALAHKDKLIIHATCTGYGGTVVEPGVPRWEQQFSAVCDLVKAGFPQEKVVIRVDPIIPTEKGVETALRVIEAFMDVGYHFSRYRVSILDMYPHVRDRFKAAGLPLPYGDKFMPASEQVFLVDAILREAKEYWTIQTPCPASELRIESCAEPGLKEAIPCGCISDYDLALLGFKDEGGSVGRQRPHCMCYGGKTELLTNKKQCPHGCLYCYWKA